MMIYIYWVYINLFGIQATKEIWFSFTNFSMDLSVFGRSNLEIFRPLGIKGYRNLVIYTAFPFMQGFHASPYDFTRVTEEGIKVLHKEFETIEVKPFGGPTSGMLWTFQEWVAILLSFGNKKLHMIIYLVMMCLTFPIKFLDYFLIKHPMAKNIASGFVYIGRKINDTI